ncbi:MAG: hypothetical protein Unbinned97contig1000_20 [Prokaryotic dsDNA virus sp.]|nr:MAG: hypothetical protein Unbinned97contig1000_20 [Prokaryotic dsDNA virus sp.]|tara:strand:- start:3897 stop:4148 length:252 start_codon:yes stop_codon:yes gene_type:complete
MKIIKIEWVDAETIGDNSWQELESAIEYSKNDPPVMTTIGFLLHECDTHLSVTESIGSQECGHVTKIPTGMIKDMKVLLENEM